jgi:signal transduction histidine kinase
VSNARQHAAEATVVAVELSRDHDTVRLTVHDDGRPVPAGRARRARPSYGLAGMRERFSLLGGEVSAGPDPAGGWTVEATIPATIDRERMSR